MSSDDRDPENGLPIGKSGIDYSRVKITGSVALKIERKTGYGNHWLMRCDCGRKFTKLSTEIGNDPNKHILCKVCLKARLEKQRQWANKEKFQSMFERYGTLYLNGRSATAREVENDIINQMENVDGEYYVPTCLNRRSHGDPLPLRCSTCGSSRFVERRGVKCESCSSSQDNTLMCVTCGTVNCEECAYPHKSDELVDYTTISHWLSYYTGRSLSRERIRQIINQALMKIAKAADI
jgi:hypothetical protein